MRSFDDMPGKQVDSLENYLKAEGPEISGDYRDLQEAALKAVLKLSKQSVSPVIEQIEGEYHEKKEQLDYSKQKAAGEQKKVYDLEAGKIEQISKEELEKVQKEHDEQNRVLSNNIRDQKEEAEYISASETGQAKKNYEYETMIADIVQKGSVKKAEQSTTELKAAAEAGSAQIEALKQRAIKILCDYKISVTEENEPDAGADIKEPMHAFEQQRKIAEVHLQSLNRQILPKLVLNAGSYIIGVMVCAAAGIGIWAAKAAMGWSEANFELTLGGGILVSAGMVVFCGGMLRRKALKRIKFDFEVISKATKKAHAAIESFQVKGQAKIEQELEAAKLKYKSETEAAREKFERIQTAATQKRDAVIKAKTNEYYVLHGRIEEDFTKKTAEIERSRDEQLRGFKSDYDSKIAEIEKHFAGEYQKIENERNASMQRLREYWAGKLAIIKKMLDETKQLDKSLFCEWNDAEWRQWTPEKESKQLVRLGRISVDFKELAEPVRELMEPGLKGTDTTEIPAVLLFPNRCSLLVQAPHKAREAAIELIKSVMMRLFTSVAPGQIHFNIFDPIGLGDTFVGFMHAIDYEKSLVGGRIWTDSEHIQQCLGELTTHMENVIQKYLRNEFETIEQYNEQAGELAEPYRFLVIADFPTNFNDESLRRLKSIINSGPRCGVYTLIMCDDSQKLPIGISVQDLAANGVHLVFQKDRFTWQNEAFKKFRLDADKSPNEELLTELVCKVGAAAIDSTRVEIPFETIAPPADKIWSQDSSGGINVPVGRSGAKRLQYIQLGKGVNQHMLIAGKTGSGKSTLLHIIVSNLAMWYSPDQVELYLIDFKQGVEFKTYAVHKLPHARAVAIESDREFGLSILQRLDTEMTARGEKFRQARVQDIAAYRNASKEIMPRTILIVDEFQILFSEDDKIAHNSTMLLEKLVRQGRAFGIHVILGSQSLAGTSGISRSIMGQMAVRIALQCSEMDSQIILNEDNVVARLLSRPGEAIYNDAGGMVVGNNPFQVAWLSKTTQDNYLSEIAAVNKEVVLKHEPMIVFEGNVPAEISNNANLLKSAQNADGQVPQAWLGEPVTIKSPTAVAFARHNGSNLLVTGQQDLAMAGVFNSVLVSLMVRCGSDVGKITVLDGNSADSMVSMKLRKIDSAFGHKCRFAHPNDAGPVLAEIAAEVRARVESSSQNASSEFLIISPLQRFRSLYRKDDDWSFKADEKGPSNDKLLAEILREGPAVGIHVIVGADNFNTIEKFIDRQTLREFNYRVLFQMSASDSSNLIDSPVANQLGFQRALLYNEEQGLLEKFRFYAPPEDEWLSKIAKKV